MDDLRRLSQITVGEAESCIYCGTTESGRTNEHLIAESLGGNLVMKKASCVACCETTKRIEGSVSGLTYKILRAANNYRSKRPKGMPTEGVIELVDDRGAKEEIRLPLKDLPLLVIVPHYPAPPFASNIPGLSPPWMALALKMLPNEVEFHNRSLAARRNRSGRFSAKANAFRVGDFERVLYKTFLGLMQWKTPGSPYIGILRDRVLGKLEYFNSAGDVDAISPADLYSLPSWSADSENIYSISFFPVTENGVSFQYCSIRLFPMTNFPTYILRAGPVLGDGLTWAINSHSYNGK